MCDGYCSSGGGGVCGGVVVCGVVVGGGVGGAGRKGTSGDGWGAAENVHLMNGQVLEVDERGESGEGLGGHSMHLDKKECGVVGMDHGPNAFFADVRGESGEGLGGHSVHLVR